MIKVKLQFTLVGRTDEWKKYIKQDSNIDWRNSDTLDYVKGIINKQFGNRPIVFVNKKNLVNDSMSYPKYFSAGWFIGEDNGKELVIVAHGESFEKANKLLMYHVKTIDWENLAKNI